MSQRPARARCGVCATIMRGGRYNEHEARVLIQTLLKTLAYLHNKEIAHRDLKPENLLLKSPDNDTQVRPFDECPPLPPSSCVGYTVVV